MSEYTKRYITYWNGWEQGNPYIAVVPNFAVELSGWITTNELQASYEYPYHFQTDMLFFTGNANYYISAHERLTNLHLLSNLVNDEQKTALYFSPTNYLQFTASSISVYIDGRVRATSSMGSNSYIYSIYSASFSGRTILRNVTNLYIINFIMTASAFGGTDEYAEFYNGATPAPEPTSDEPYSNGGFSDLDNSVGGDGDYDRVSDVIPLPDLPTLNVVDTGFLSIYNPSKTQINALGNYMWNNTNDFVDVLTKLISNPLETILGLHIIPFEPTGTTEYIKLGNVTTNIQAKKINDTNFLSFDCGTVTIAKYFNAYLDFAPYTKTQLYLPFIGYVTLDTDDIISKPINLSYYVDILTGACTAIISVNGSVLYQFSGNCAYSIPVTGADLSNIISSVLSIANTIVGVGYSAFSGGGMSPTTAMSSVSNTVNDVMSMHPNINRSGGLGGTNGLLGVRVPYFCINYPHQNLPAKLTEFQGYPLYNYKMFSDISGYTVVLNPQLNNMTCTENELNEILSLLQNGVIF